MTPQDPDQIGELLRHGLGRLADETPRYVDSAELRETVVVRARHDRTSKRMMAMAAALVPVAAFAGYAIRGGNTGSGGPENIAGAPSGSVSASVSPTPTLSPTPTAAAPVPGVAVTVAPGSAPSPSAKATAPVPPVTPTTPPPASADPDRLVVQLSVVSDGVDATGRFKARYSVSWSGGSVAPTGVFLWEGDRVLESQDLAKSCDAPAKADSVSGAVTFADKGPHVLIGRVRSGCKPNDTAVADTVRWVWLTSTTPTSSPSPTVTPTPTASPSPTTTGGDSSPEATGPTTSASPVATPTGEASPSPTSTATTTAGLLPLPTEEGSASRR